MLHEVVQFNLLLTFTLIIHTEYLVWLYDMFPGNIPP